MFDDVS